MPSLKHNFHLYETPKNSNTVTEIFNQKTFIPQNQEMQRLSEQLIKE